MSDKVTFDFETGEIIWDTDSQKGSEFDPDLKKKKNAILAAAGFEQIDLKQEINSMLKDLGLSDVIKA